MTKPVKPRWGDTDPSYTIEPTTAKKNTGWLSGEKPPFQFMNWLQLKNYEWINWFENKLAANEKLSIESDDPVTWDGGTLGFTSNIVIRFRNEAGDLRINQIAAGTINIAADSVVVVRLDRTNASPVTLALQVTYASLAEGEYGVFPASVLDLNNDDLETLLFIRRDFTHGVLGAEQVLQVIPYGTKHFIDSTFDFGNSDNQRISVKAKENIILSKAGTTNKIVGLNGSDLSIVNPAYVLIDGGGANNYAKFEDSPSYVDGISGTIIGQEFGITNGVDWVQDRLISIYATNDSTGKGYVFSTFDTQMKITPSTAAEIGYENNPSTNNDDSDIFVWTATDVTTSLQSRPCKRIGTKRVRWTATGTFWTTQALTSKDGIGNFNKEKNFYMSISQMGATSGKYTLDNGGTAPTYGLTNVIAYNALDNGWMRCKIDFSNSASNTPGSGVQALKFALPFVNKGQVDSGIATRGGFVRLINGSTIFDCDCIIDNNTSLIEFAYTTVVASTKDAVRHNNQNNVIRQIQGEFDYKAF